MERNVSYKATVWNSVTYANTIHQNKNCFEELKFNFKNKEAQDDKLC